MSTKILSTLDQQRPSQYTQTIEPSIIQLQSMQNLKEYLNQNVTSFQTQQTLRINQHKIIQNNQLSVEQQEQHIIQCRICLQSYLQSKNVLVKICKCTGTVEYVHRDCFQMWVQKCIYLKQKLQREKMIQTKKFQCQMCKYPVQIQYQLVTEYIGTQNVLTLIKQYYFKFIFIMTILISSFVAFLYVIARISTQKLSFKKSDPNFITSIIIVSASVLLFFVILLAIYFLYDQFMFDPKYKILYVGNGDEDVEGEIQQIERENKKNMKINKNMKKIKNNDQIEILKNSTSQLNSIIKKNNNSSHQAQDAFSWLKKRKSNKIMPRLEQSINQLRAN